MNKLKIPQSWALTRVEQISSKVGSGVTPKGGREAYSDQGVVFIRSQNVLVGKLDLSDVAFIPEQTHAKMIASEVQPNDVLLNITGASIGRCAVAPPTLPQANVNQHVCIVRPNDRICSSFLMNLFNSDFGKRLIYECQAGGNREGLNFQQIRSFKVPLPPLPVQQITADVFSCWDQAIELTEKLIAAKQKRKQALMQQLLARQDNSKTQKLGQLFGQRKEKGVDNLPTYSVTMNDGLVLRDSLDRKNETSLRSDQHLLIEENDIAYNMMRMWQGALGLAPESGLVSPAYVVLRSLGEVDPLFTSYWFKTPRVVKKFQDYSHGMTKDRLRLYFKDFASIALPVPPLDLQRKIAKALSTCDRELDCLQQKVGLLQQQKKGLMQQLLTGKIRVKLSKAKGKK